MSLAAVKQQRSLREEPDLLERDEMRELLYRLPPKGVPSLSSANISWRRQGDQVAIAIDVLNHGRTPTTPCGLVIEAAVLGAFAPWRPLSRIPVGALAPGESRRLALTVSFDALPSLPADRPISHVLQFERLTSAHWAGNLNIWFDTAPEHAVEVHRALDVQVQAGTRAALGVYLPRERSEVDIALVSSNADWSASIEPWGFLSVLVVEAPAEVSRTSVHLRVTRRADGRVVPVDFTFESVQGESDSLGCLYVG
jgi:hypothetical protein